MSGVSDPVRRIVLELAERHESSWLYRLDYWLSLPWRCKIRHTQPVYQPVYSPDGAYVEEASFECGRCQHWFGNA